MKKFKSLKIAAIVAATSLTTMAHAQVFSYNTTLGGNPVVLSVDTNNGTASYTGSGTNATFTGADFSSFNPADPRGNFTFTGASGVINNAGTNLTPDALGGGAPRIIFNSSGTTQLWVRALDPSGTPAPFDLPGSFSPLPPSSTSSGGLSSTGGFGGSGGSSVPTGGSSSGGSSSGGGTSVPAPGILGLLGLGLAGLAFGRRRKKS